MKYTILLIISIIMIILFIIYYLKYGNKELFMSEESKNQLSDAMEKIHNILKENDIQYWIICGTLLGSIRHKDFIPWDDDMDIGIFEKDMEKFNNIDFGYEKINPSKDNCGKIFTENGSYIDIFPFAEKSDRFEYLEDRARFLWPREYFFKNELLPIRNDYKFGRLNLCGPNCIEPCATRFWKDWKKCIPKFDHWMSHPFKTLKIYLTS